MRRLDVLAIVLAGGDGRRLSPLLGTDVAPVLERFTRAAVAERTADRYHDVVGGAP